MFSFTTDWSDLYGQLDLKTVWICVICGEFVYLCDKHMEIWIQ
nr:MAG TPA: C2H2 type zinc-finger protein [Caudoviricetes sp.]